MLTLDDEGLLAASTGFLIITFIILFLFLLGSYSHKMIGLQTIQIIQFHYFMTMMVEEKAFAFVKSMNVLKYSAFGGYSDFKMFYGIVGQEAKSITSSSVDKIFTFVGLLKYFTLNVNLSLIFPILGLCVFSVCLIRKYKKRAEYMTEKDEHIKDKYTVIRRSAQWVYDHCVFPLIYLFGMISFFCTIILLSLKVSVLSENNEKNANLIEKSSFIPHLGILFMTFFIFSCEIFLSYDQFVYSRLTETEKARVPSSALQKLEHDSNNPDRQNYKPGYILVYLVYYFFVQVFSTINVLAQSIGGVGTQLMLALTGGYLLIIWKWRPYMPVVEFHNKALRLNHFTAFLFTVFCEIFNRVDMDPIFAITIIYLSLALLVAISLVCCARIIIELKFRKRLEDEPKLLNRNDGKQEVQLKGFQKTEKMMVNNKYSFEHQINMPYQVRKLPNSPGFNGLMDDEYEKIKKSVRKEIYSRRNFRINVDNNLFMEEYVMRDFTRKGSLNKKLMEGEENGEENDEDVDIK